MHAATAGTIERMPKEHAGEDFARESAHALDKTTDFSQVVRVTGVLTGILRQELAAEGGDLRLLAALVGAAEIVGEGLDAAQVQRAHVDRVNLQVGRRRRGLDLQAGRRIGCGVALRRVLPPERAAEHL